MRSLVPNPTRPAAPAVAAILMGLVCALALWSAGPAQGAPEPGAGAGLGPASSYVPGELIVHFDDGMERVVQLSNRVTVPDAVQALDDNPHVTYALPNYIARASGVPNDPGDKGVAGGWQFRQWNFLPCGSACGGTGAPLPYQSRGGINAPGAWEVLAERGRGPGKGVKVAVLDTGVAYVTRKPRFRRSPDFARKQFLEGKDFVDHDPWASDEDGHGTHVAGTIAERTNNKRALTGLASSAKIIPVRVLDENGFGTAAQIARGIRFATKQGARVINMSFEFSPSIDRCSQIKSVCKAVRLATRDGVIVIAAAGNTNGDAVAMPSAAPGVLSVGRTTTDACVADGSRGGPGLDLVAPGGGAPHSIATCLDDPGGFSRSAPIYQLTFRGAGLKRFGYPGGYTGTSMAAAHASGVAALVISSRVLGSKPSPTAIECQMESTARNSTTELGEAYDPNLFGAGLIDAAAAVRSRAPGC